jgi:hypothetical protein
MTIMLYATRFIFCWRNGASAEGGPQGLLNEMAFFNAIQNRRNLVGRSFRALRYSVSAVGRDEAVIQNYIRNQEKENQRLEKMNLWC